MCNYIHITGESLGGQKEMRRKKIWEDEEAVSPVIAVILMVAITVVLAAILYVWASGFIAGGKNAPRGAIQCVSAGGDTYTIKVVEMNPAVGVTGIDWYLYDNEGETVENNYGSVDEIYGLVEGNVTFHDNDRDGKVSPEDTFTVAKELPDGTPIPEGYKLSLKFGPTNDGIATAVLTG